METKSPNFWHEQPSAPFAPPSTTVLHPSELHALTFDSQNLHSNAASQREVPLRIASNRSRADGCPMQFCATSWSLATGSATRTGSVSSVSFVPLTYKLKETVGPAKEIDEPRAAPWTSRAVAHMAMVIGTPPRSWLARLPRS
eukprot:scaffold25623_cov101-Isochrysis_galbana.AAC.2